MTRTLGLKPLVSLCTNWQNLTQAEKKIVADIWDPLSEHSRGWTWKLMVERHVLYHWTTVPLKKGGGFFNSFVLKSDTQIWRLAFSVCHLLLPLSNCCTLLHSRANPNNTISKSFKLFSVESRIKWNAQRKPLLQLSLATGEMYEKVFWGKKAFCMQEETKMSKKWSCILLNCDYHLYTVHAHPGGCSEKVL